MRHTLLVVDDINANREILKKMLCAEYAIREAAHGADALALLRREPDAFSAVLLDLSMPVMDGFEMLRQMRGDSVLAQMPVLVITGSEDEADRVRALALGANDFVAKPYSPEIIKHCLRNCIALRESALTVSALRMDRLTGIYNREAFLETADEMIAAHEPGYYILAAFDIDNFKVINDQYGSEKGDSVLRSIAGIFQRGFSRAGGICGRIMADHFAVLYPRSFAETDEIQAIRRSAARLDGSMLPIRFSIGRYVADNRELSANAMYDRAALAQATVKGRADAHIALYDESMRERLLREQEIVGEMRIALRQGQFEVWYQPQFNHASGALIGAEALVRWRHPQRGLVPPVEFIPVFEKNGFIYELDQFVWERVCACLRKWLDEGRNPLPVSVNLSRYDLFREDLVDVLIGLARSYELPASLLRLEITESAFANSTAQIVQIVQQLIDHGFTLEIDDFGSGYSSLNILKDVPAQILKLDMRFLESDTRSQRGGNIIESVVRMTKWLGMSVIAEGVETIEQANYLKSIGCIYVQGYLYARPAPVEEYEALARNVGKEERLLVLETVENLDNNAFWDPRSMDTLIFNSYVGGACIFEYHDQSVEVLRANDKYTQAIGSAHLSTEDALRLVWSDHLDEANRLALREALHKAIETRDEVTGEFLFLDIPGSIPKTYLRVTLRMIASAGERYLFYCTNENITAQREAEQREHASAQHLQAIINNVRGGVSAALLRSAQVEYVFTNDWYYRMLGYTREQFAQECPRGIVDLIHPDDLAMVVSAAERAQETDTTFQVEYRARRRDGSKIWLRSNGSVCRLEGFDDPVQLAVTEDITHEKETELPAILAAFMQASTDMLFVKDRELRYVCCSRAFALAAGQNSAQDVIAKTDYDLVDKATADRYTADERAILESEQPKTGILERIPTKDGSARYSCTSKYPLRDADGRVVGVYAIARDDDDEAARENERVWQIVAEHSSRLIYRYDLATRTASADFTAFAGHELFITDRDVPDSLVEKGVVLPESVDDFLRAFRELDEGRASGGARVHMTLPGGAARWFDMKYSRIDAGGNRPASAVISFLDITDDHEKQLAYDRYLQTINRDATSDDVFMYFEADVTRDVTEKGGGTRLTGGLPVGLANRAQVIEYFVRTFIQEEDQARCREFFAREHLITLFSDGVRDLREDWAVNFSDGRSGYIRAETQLIEDPYTRHIKAYSIMRDVTDEKRAALQVKQQAERDGMTGLYNKSTAEALMRQRLACADGAPCALLIADLDSLKSINDSIGHPQGDEAIRAVAHTLRAQFRKTDIVGRIGGDEFAVFLVGVSDEAQLRGMMADYQRKLSGLHIGRDRDVAVRSSLGAAIGIAGRTSYEELFQQADQALYHVKRNGKNGFALYAPDMERNEAARDE